MGHAAWAGEAEAKKWIDSEFQPSTLSKDQQMAEMKWFIDAAKKLQAKGVKEISVVSETITTHEYESKTLAKAFTEITGITVKHDLIQEGDVVEKLQTSMQSGKSIYDGWISDSDLIGTHYRYGKIMNLTDYMAGKGKEWTNPGIDIKDFIGTSFTTAPDKKLYQLPDQQFANLYWFRADLFARQDLKDKFKAKYGEVQLYSPYAYDATKLVVAAMKKADSADPKKYLAALAGIEYDGVVGKIKFDDKGDVLDGAITVYQVKGGKWEVMGTVGGAPAAAAPAAAPAAEEKKQ